MKMIQGRYGRASAADMYEFLGLHRYNGKLPAEGMSERLIQNVRVYVKPLPEGEPGQRQSLRVTAICECGKHVPVGRMHQHKCNPSYKRYGNRKLRNS